MHRNRPLPMARGRVLRNGSGASIAAAVIVAVALTACSQTVTRHGHYFEQSDVQQIQPGMSQDQVRASLGTPATTATVGTGTAYYYISSTTQQTSFFKPTETDRQVVAVYFTPLGSVERVANYGLKDGKVFDFVTATTAHHAKDESLLKQMFRNLGIKQLGL